MSKEFPAIFNTRMVKAILDGTKTQTRRPIRGLPPLSRGQKVVLEDGVIKVVSRGFGQLWDVDKKIKSPFGKPGDTLWVRETFWVENDTCDHEYCPGCDLGSTLSYGKGFSHPQYVATPECFDYPELKFSQTVVEHDGEPCHGYWWLSPPDGWDGENESHRKNGEWVFLPTQYQTKHPSIHMPRWASRINLKVKRVWLENLQDISEEDAKAEGVHFIDATAHDPCGLQARLSFERLWNSIYGTWDENPLICCCEFERMT